MQLRGHTYNAVDEPLEVADRDSLEDEIECLKNIVGIELLGKGIKSVQICPDNFQDITSILDSKASFMLGRLTALQQVHSDLYGKPRVIPWLRNPENN